MISITGYNHIKFEGEIEKSYNLVIGNKNDPHYDHFISVDVNEAVEYIYDNGIPECIAMGFDENLESVITELKNIFITGTFIPFPVELKIEVMNESKQVTDFVIDLSEYYEVYTDDLGNYIFKTKPGPNKISIT